MPEFAKQGDQYVEVEPASKSIIPNALELTGAIETTAGETGKAPEPKKMVWPNEVVTLGRYRCPSQLGLRLIRTLATQPHTPPQLTCELGDLLEPLLVISADDSNSGWDRPQIRVIDLSPAKLPSRTVVAINLTRIPLAAQFDTVKANLAPASIGLLPLPPTAPEVIRFRVDAQVKSGMVPVANSSYQLGASCHLILLASPNSQVAEGVPPLSLQMVLYQ